MHVTQKPQRLGSTTLRIWADTASRGAVHVGDVLIPDNLAGLPGPHKDRYTFLIAEAKRLEEHYNLK